MKPPTPPLARKPALDPFYPVVPSAAWVERLLAVGTRLVQLRVKELEGDALRVEILRAHAACRAREAQLILNDYWRLAIILGIDFVHLGQQDLDTADIAAIRAAGIRLGVSTHDHAELERALALDPDYVALGPIYPTVLKVMPFAPQGLERIGEWKRLVGARPLVAIGGLTLERVPGCLAAGADAVAVVNDVVSNPDPEARARAWIQATRGNA